VDLEGKRLLLSGATGGIGRAIAGELAGNGASLVLSSRKREQLEELAQSLPGGADRHEVIVADLAEPGAAEELVNDAGNVDGLVANAALPATGKLEDFSSDEVQRAIRVNFESPILMAKGIAPKLAKKGEGHLVFISSLSGKVGSPRSSLYNSTKFGLRGFAFGLREELRALPRPETIVCRCEDVRYEKLQQAASFRAAKLHTRCGMGPCQARICGPATEFLFGWRTDSVRPPILPARAASLIVPQEFEKESSITQ